MKLDRLFFGLVILSTLALGCEPGVIISKQCESPETCVPLPEPRPSEHPPQTPVLPTGDEPTGSAFVPAPVVGDEPGNGAVSAEFVISEDGGMSGNDATPATESDAEPTPSPDGGASTGEDSGTAPSQEDGGTTTTRDDGGSVQSDAESVAPIQAPPFMVRDALQSQMFVNGHNVVVARFTALAGEQDAQFGSIVFRSRANMLPALESPTIRAVGSSAAIPAVVTFVLEDANAVRIEFAFAEDEWIVAGQFRAYELRLNIFDAVSGTVLATNMVGDPAVTPADAWVLYAF